MKKVAKAREILTDSAKRRLYDQLFMRTEITDQPNQDMEDDELFYKNRSDHSFPVYQNWWNTRVNVPFLLYCV